MLMPFALLKLADECGVKVEYWDFWPPLVAVYWHCPGLPPVIGLSRSLLSNRTRLRCVLAEELGHHFTGAGSGLPRTVLCYRKRLEVSRAEYLALKWAALYLMPGEKIVQAIRKGVTERWELAELFDVTEELVEFRLRLPDVQSLRQLYRGAKATQGHLGG